MKPTRVLLIATLLPCGSAHATFAAWVSGDRVPNGCESGTPLTVSEFASPTQGLTSHCNAQVGSCGAVGLENIVIDEVAGNASANCFITDRFGNFHFEAVVSSVRTDVDALNKGPCRDCDVSTDNPINLGTLNKFLVETDYIGAGPFPLRFARTFNSKDVLVDPRAVLGRKWRHSYQRSLQFVAMGGGSFNVHALRPGGRGIGFDLVAIAWVGPKPFPYGLVELKDGGGATTGWQFLNGDNDEVETYDATGRLLSIANRAGLTQTLSYDAGGRLAAVADPFGRTLTFAYDASDRLASVTDPTGNVYAYGYSAGISGVSSVTAPDGTVLQYLYESDPNQGPNNTLVTGIIDRNGARYATFTYSGTSGITSQLAGGAERIAITGGGPCCDGNTTATDAFGQARRLTYGDVGGGAPNAVVPLRVPVSFNVPWRGRSKAYTYDANGFVASRKDFNDNLTTFIRADPFGRRDLETQRTEGLTSGGGNTPQTRTITTAWNPSFRLPTLITEPGRTTAMTYDSFGNMLTRTITDTLTGESRTWTTTYNTNGMPLTTDGPRTDVADVTTYTYYPDDDADLGKRGNVATITDALGFVTRLTDYNPDGRLTVIVAPTGLVSTMTFDERQRLTSSDVGGETTSYSYDGVGNLTRRTNPDGSFLDYTYDDAHRLTEIVDSGGDRVVYTLDAMGNHTLEEVFDALGNLVLTRSGIYDTLNRLQQDVGATGQSTTFSYDNEFQVTSVDGALAGAVDVTSRTYDALNRVTRTTDPGGGQLTQSYNALDQLTSITDPRGLATSYTIDALGNLTQLNSPDAGVSGGTYDEAGNLLTMVDAKGETTSYTYDELNRVTSISTLADLALEVVLDYDEGTNGVGRLTTISEASGTIHYDYDGQGRVVTETRRIGGVAYVTDYLYDAAGRLESMVYPSGRTVDHAFDAMGRVSEVTTTLAGVPSVAAGGVAYHPFGGVRTFTQGNGQTYSRGMDRDGRTDSYTLGAAVFDVTYDAAGNPSAIAEAGNAPNTNSYTYDGLYRLTQATLPARTIDYSYDAVGNRTTRSIAGATETYAYGASRNRLASLTPPIGPARAFTFDANGSTVDDGVNSYEYDARRRLSRATGAAGAATDYRYNALGERIEKSSGTDNVIFAYDTNRRLLAEYTPAGRLKREYVYLGAMPLLVAVVR